MILDEGISVEYGRFNDLLNNNDSKISKFFKNKDK